MTRQLDFGGDSFRLVRIGASDAKLRSDNFLDLRREVISCEEMYPGISKWFERKVSFGLKTGERSAFVGELNGCPVAAAIIKKGRVSKFCHLRVHSDHQTRSLGDLFFVMMTLELRHLAKEVRFTLPESLWESRKVFFNSFGFDHAAKCERQYRLFDSELFTNTEFSNLYSAAMNKLPRVFGKVTIGNHSLLTGAVLAVQPKPLQQILSGAKTVEIRTRFSHAWEGKRVSLYGTVPVSGLAGEASILKVIEGDPNKIWDLCGHSTGCSREEYEKYVGGRKQVYALVLTDVQEFSDPIPLAQLSHLLGVNLAPPQSYLSLANNDSWLGAVTLAAALQGAVTVSR